MDFLKKITFYLSSELRAWNSSETLQMVLQMILKLFRLFLAKKKFCINFLFFEFFCIPRVMKFFDKSLSPFLRVRGLKFIRNFTNGVADVFSSFSGFCEPKKILYKFLIFWVFCIPGVMHSFDKSLSSFLRVRGLKFHQKLHKWCCRRIFKLFRLLRAKKNFV